MARSIAPLSARSIVSHLMQTPRGNFFSVTLALFAAVATLSAALCGPELTTPGSGDVSGTWHADGPAAGLSNITMVLEQTTRGGVTGTFVPHHVR